MTAYDSHRKHRNVLYGLVIVLAILQTSTFIILSLQISKLNSKIDYEITQTSRELMNFTTSTMDAYDDLYQVNFNQISNAIANQQDYLNQELNMIKSSRDDFSGIAQEAVKSVVTVRTSSSIGTGFIISQNGYIVTNDHILEDSEESVQAITYERKTFSADLVGRDKVRDLALLKIPGTYDYLKLADSKDLQVGKKVIAIGNPLGLSFTVTEGIISALHRLGPSGLSEYIQTDVSLNPGNSGGPLIDMQGNVVGINNFKIGGAEALGFSLESDVIRERVNIMANQTLID